MKRIENLHPAAKALRRILVSDVFFFSFKCSYVCSVIVSVSGRKTSPKFVGTIYPFGV